MRSALGTRTRRMHVRTSTDRITPAQRQSPVWRQADPRAERRAFAIERPAHPLDIGSRCWNKLKTPDLKHREFETRKMSGQGIETGEIHHGEIAAKFLVAANALIVIQEVAASVEDQSILVYFDGFRVVRGMAVDKRNIGLIDEAARKSSLLFWNLISPICSPMNRCNDQIAWPPYALHLFRDPRDAFIGKVADKV